MNSPDMSCMADLPDAPLGNDTPGALSLWGTTRASRAGT